MHWCQRCVCHLPEKILRRSNNKKSSAVFMWRCVAQQIRTTSCRGQCHQNPSQLLISCFLSSSCAFYIIIVLSHLAICLPTLQGLRCILPKYASKTWTAILLIKHYAWNDTRFVFKFAPVCWTQRLRVTFSLLEKCRWTILTTAGWLLNDDPMSGLCTNGGIH